MDQKITAETVERKEIKLAENPVAITDLSEIEKAKALPDWNCDYCNGDNDDPDKFCTNCGAERGSKTRTIQEYAESEVPRGKRRLSEADEYAIPKTMFSEGQRPTPKVDLPLPFKRKQSTFTSTGLFLLFGIIIIAILYALFSTKEISLTVAEMKWERIVYVEESKEVKEEDWDVPAGASIIKSWKVVDHEEDVFDHYNPVKVPYQKDTGRTKDRVCGKVNLGNGYFGDKICKDPIYETKYRTEQEKVYRKEPVYRKKYRYTIDRWFDVKNPPHSSETDKSPYWPRFTLSRDQQERTRSEVYTIDFRGGNGKIYNKSYDHNTWGTYHKGKGVKGRINALGMLSYVNE